MSEVIEQQADSLETFLPFCEGWESLVLDRSVSEIMVNGNGTLFFQRGGRIIQSEIPVNAELLKIGLEFLAGSLGKYFDDAHPIMDARLPDGSRVAAELPPASSDGLGMTIRKFSERKYSTADLVALGSMPQEVADLLSTKVRNHKTLIVSGATDSGKTTLCNALLQHIPLHERLLIIEDTREIYTAHPCVRRYEAKEEQRDNNNNLLVPAVTVRQLLKACLRNRPDRLIIGEVRGAEAFDLLDALNTGHEGSMSTIHANSASGALAKLLSLALRADINMPAHLIQEMIGDLVQVVVQASKTAEGTRYISEVAEVRGFRDGRYQIETLFSTDKGDEWRKS
jgi:pilus assembly protein CpaF